MFKTKLDSDSQIKHYKAYLVVKGFSQIKDIDSMRYTHCYHC